MVTCTTPPFRAAVRLNSGVRPLQRKVLGTEHLRHRQLAAGQSGHVLRQLRSHSTRLKAQSSVTASPARMLRKRARIVHRIPGHRLRAAQSAGPPLWTWLVRKEPSSALHSAQDRGEQLAGSGLTIHSSRRRFAARLNSGVSAQKKQISAKSFLDKRHKSFSDPLSPALRHISDLIHLRAVSDLLAPGNLSHPRHRANSQLQRANNSFKPTPLRGVVVTSSHPSVPAAATLPQRRGLIQALDGSCSILAIHETTTLPISAA